MAGVDKKCFAGCILYESQFPLPGQISQWCGTGTLGTENRSLIVVCCDIFFYIWHFRYLFGAKYFFGRYFEWTIYVESSLCQIASSQYMPFSSGLHDDQIWTGNNITDFLLKLYVLKTIYPHLSNLYIALSSRGWLNNAVLMCLS